MIWPNLDVGAISGFMFGIGYGAYQAVGKTSLRPFHLLLLFVLSHLYIRLGFGERRVAIEKRQRQRLGFVLTFTLRPFYIHSWCLFYHIRGVANLSNTTKRCCVSIGRRVARQVPTTRSKSRFVLSFNYSHLLPFSHTD